MRLRVTTHATLVLTWVAGTQSIVMKSTRVVPGVDSGPQLQAHTEKALHGPYQSTLLALRDTNAVAPNPSSAMLIITVTISPAS